MYGFSDRLPFEIINTGKMNQGQAGNALSAGSFKRFTQHLKITLPIRVEAVVWEIQTTQTYELQLVSSVAASPPILKTLATGRALVGGPTANTITISPTVLLLPGDHYLSLYCGTAVQQRRNSVQPVFFESFYCMDVGYDGGSGTTGTCPIRLIGQLYRFRATLY